MATWRNSVFAGVNSGIVLLMLTAYWSVTEGATFTWNAPCPDGVDKGASWYPKFIPYTDTPATCTKCQCRTEGEDVGFTCYSCGVVSIVVGPVCHVVYDRPEQRYPDCCHTAVVCPGDKGYNSSMAGVHTIG